MLADFALSNAMGCRAKWPLQAFYQLRYTQRASGFDTHPEILRATRPPPGPLRQRASMVLVSLAARRAYCRGRFISDIVVSVQSASSCAGVTSSGTGVPRKPLGYFNEGLKVLNGLRFAARYRAS